MVDSEGDPHLEKWSTCFRFDTDQARLENIQKLNRQLQPLQKKMEDYECARHVRPNARGKEANKNIRNNGLEADMDGSKRAGRGSKFAVVFNILAFVFG